jgi:hypothetical protein
MEKVLITGNGARYVIPFDRPPALSARTVQLPVARVTMSRLEIEQIDGVSEIKVTGSDEDATALELTALPDAYTWFEGCGKTIELFEK